MTLPLWPYGDAALTLGLAVALGLLVALAAALRRAGASAATTRTLVHVATALAVAAVPWGFRTATGPVLLAIAFAGVNAWAVRRRRLAALHAARPDSYGTVAMPLALVALGVWDGLAHPAAWAIAWTTLALADPLGGWAGRRFGPEGAPKSWAGSLAFFAAALAIALVALSVRPSPPAPNLVAHALAFAAVTAACEWLGRRGWDNLLVVLGGYFVLAYAAPGAGSVAAWLALPVALAFGYASFRLRLLSGSGAVAAALFAWLVLVGGSLPYLLSGVGFFLISSLLSRWNRGRSTSAEAIAEKGHRRDAYQVAANGFAGALALAGAAAGLFGLDSPAPLVLWTGAFAAAAADTWATEIGTRFGGTPRLVTSGRAVPRGTSGGVSLAGLLGGAAGAAVVGALAVAGVWAIGRFGLERGALGPDVVAETQTAPADLLVRFGGIALAAGLAGSFVDSLLGATVQRRFRRADGALTEKPATDGVPNAPAGGWAWMTNDTVNLLATVAGALVALALHAALRP